MTTKKISLASDNWSPAHPLVIEAIVRANEGVAPAYGLDPWTEKTKQMIQDVFKKTCQVLIVPTGTGANVLGLRVCCKAYESTICTDIAHIHYQETGATEALVGCKLLIVPSIYWFHLKHLEISS